MDASRWERLGAASGLIFVGLMAVAFAIVPSEPPLSDTGALVDHAAENRTGLLTQTYLVALGTLFLLWFAGNVRAHIRRNEGVSDRLASVAFGGAVVAATLSAIGVTMYGALALRANQTQDPAIVGMLADVGTIAFTFLYIPLAVFIGATALASFRTGAFPMWHGIAGGIFAIAFAALPAVLYGTTGFWSIDEYLAPTVGYTAFLAWTLVTSIMLMIGEASKVEVVEEPHEHWHLRRAAGS